MGYEKHTGQKSHHRLMSADLCISHSRSGQRQPGQPPDQKRIYQVNDQIHQMVSPKIKLMDVIINGKRQYADRAAWKKAKPVSDARKTGRNTAEENIFVVKMK
jgi:hypothetical protein